MQSGYGRIFHRGYSRIFHRGSISVHVSTQAQKYFYIYAQLFLFKYFSTFCKLFNRFMIDVCACWNVGESSFSVVI